MTYLLDTNIVSEWVKPRPSPAVTAWLAGLDEDSVFLSVVTLGELRHGVNRLPVGQRRSHLDDWLRIDLRARFDRRIIPIDEQIANEWGAIVARRDAAGKPIGVMDAFLAATSNIHELTLATRNAADFVSAAKTVFNPWAAG